MTTKSQLRLTSVLLDVKLFNVVIDILLLPLSFLFFNGTILSPNFLPLSIQPSLIPVLGDTIKMFFFPCSTKRLTIPNPVNVFPVPVPLVNNIPGLLFTNIRVSALKTSSCCSGNNKGRSFLIDSRLPTFISFVLICFCLSIVLSSNNDSLTKSVIPSVVVSSTNGLS